MNPSDSVLTHEDDLQWQAFCYVKDELSETEREAFEQELFNNQAAREAVATAVTLTDSVVLSARQTNSASEPARSRFATFRVVLVAAVLLVAVGVLFQGIKSQESPTQQPMQTKLFSPAETPLVVGLGELSEPKLELVHNLIDGWADSESVVGTIADAGQLDAADSEEFVDDHTDSEEVTESLKPPAWMVAAINLDKQPTEESPETPNGTEN